MATIALSSIAASSITPMTATITWRTTDGGWVLGDSSFGILGSTTLLGPPDLATDSQVEYGPTTAYGTSSTLDTTPVALHSQQLQGLTPGALYHFRVKSAASGGSGAIYGTSLYGSSTYGSVGGTPVVSGDYTFTTIAAVPADPTNLVATPLNGTSIGLTWTDNANNEANYVVEQAVGSGGTFAVLHTLGANATSDTATSLTAGVLYRYRVRATNASGNSAYTAEASATPPVVTIPLAPSGLTATAISSSRIDLAWVDNASDETGFLVERAPTAGGAWVQIGTPAANATAYQDLTVLAATTYYYRVRATNSAGNSAYSNTANATSLSGAGDVTPPVISGVTSTVTGSQTATITWSTDEGSDSQVDYGPTVAYGTTTPLNSAMVTSHSVSLSGLSPSTLYHFHVKSRDTAGNLQNGAPDQTFTTQAPADVTPPTITLLQVTAVTSSSVTITWTTNEGATDVVDYGTTLGYGASTSVDPTLRTVHARTVNGLAPTTLYHFRVRSTDGSGNERTSGDLTATTLAATGGTGTLPAPPANGTQQAGMQVLIALSTRPIDTPVWVDVSQWVRACSITRGRDSQLSAVSAATATITLGNRDRRFDPTNTAGPYYGTLKKLRRVKIRGGWQAAGYEVFTGYIEDFPMTWDGPAEATVELSAVDGFAVLALHELHRPFAAASGDTRIHEVLDDVGWTTGAGWILGHPTQGVLGVTTAIGSTGDRLISTADAQLQAADVQGANALAHIQAVEQSEMGLFFMTKEGQARFRSRHELQQLASGSGLAIFGELEASGELLYADAQINAAGDVLYNRAIISRENTAAVQQFQDDASVFDYYARTFTATLLLDSDEPTLGYAQAVVNRYKQEPPLPVIPVLDLDPTYQPAVMWPTLLGRELGEVVTVRKRPPGGGAVLEQKSRTEGITISYQAGDRPDAASWAFSWRLSPVGQEGSPWVLGDPTYSVLSTTTRLVY